MKIDKYWAERNAKAQSKLTTKSIEETQKQMVKYYDSAMKKVILQFEKTYDKLVANCKNGNQPTPADLYKLDKYWQMQGQLRNELQKLGDKQATLLSKMFMKNYEQIYRIAAIKDTGNFSDVDKSVAKQLIKSIWCADGKTWSDRVWHNTDLLRETLNNHLTDCLLAGKTTGELKHILQDDFGVSYNRADTIVRTEMAHIQTEAAKERYKDYGIEEVEILADEDERRCDVCGKLHKKRYKINEKMPVPAHPRCRCCIIPVVDSHKEKLTLPNSNDKIYKKPKPKSMLRINIQLFAKKSTDFKTVRLSKKEYAHVMSEIATWITKEQLSKNVFKKCIGDYIYTIENNGFGYFRIIGRRKIK